MGSPKTPVEDLDSLPISPALRECARNLKNHVFAEAEVSIAKPPPQFPIGRLAAVLILLYEREGIIRVLLTTRSKNLRSHPGQVALPGGKSDPADGTPFGTALREANEEVNLPLDSPHVHLLRTLPPFASLYKLIVTPVVALLSDLSILETLVPNAGEVDDIFDHPLEAFLDPSVMGLDPKLSKRNTPQWVYPEEFHNFSDNLYNGHTYRNHRFRSTSTPIKGLTSSMLILVAETGLGRLVKFEKFSENQLPKDKDIQIIP